MIRSRMNTTILLITAAFLTIACPGALHAQFSSGIEATVQDATGAIIPNAEMVITNVATHVRQRAVADSQGLVRVLQLTPGVYDASIHAQGFQAWTLTAIHVEGSDIRTIYPKLIVGGANETVTVTADTEMIETTKGDVSRVLDAETVRESPMVGQNIFATVATLAPGITGLGNAGGSIAAAGSVGVSSFTAESGYQINAAGQRQEANEYQVDGTIIDGNSRDGVVNVIPEPETVNEMKVNASNFSATRQQSGALIEIFTKSGTNKFHGMVEEFHTDNALRTRTAFENGQVPKYIRNDFGGAVGGPIWKDRTFFFGSLFWERSIQGNAYKAYVETPEYRSYIATNFPNSMANRFLSQAPTPVTTFNPGTILTASQTEANGTSVTDPLPGTLPVEGQANITTSPTVNGFQGHLRLDHNTASGKDKFFFSLFRSTSNGEYAYSRPAYNYIAPNATLYSKVDWVHVLTPNLVNEAGVSYVRNVGNQSDKIPSLPNVYYIGGVDNSDLFEQWGPSSWAQNNFIYQDNLTWTKHNHNLTFGTIVERSQDMDNFTNGIVRPYFLFLSLNDFAADAPFVQSGPVVDIGTQQVAHDLYQRVLMLYIAPYIQDDWKVNRRLTMNFGLRMDYFGHMSTLENDHTPIPMFTPQGNGDFATQVVNGSMQLRGNKGEATRKTQYRFAPRVGFAWDVFGNGRTSVHGGYGIFSDRIGEYAYANNLRSSPPYFADPYLDIYAGNNLSQFSYAPSPSGAQGFPIPPGINYTIDPKGGLVGTQVSVAGIDPNLHPPLVHVWSLGVQRQVGSFVFEADYLGTAGRDLFLQTDVNRFAGDLSPTDGVLNRLNSTFAGAIYGRDTNINNSNVAAFSVAKRFSHGWTTHVTYTFAKSLDYLSSNDNGVGGGEAVFDAQHPERQYARSDYDSRHRLSVDAVWNIPGTSDRSILHAVTSGWTVSPVIILQSGFPFTVYNSASYPTSGNYAASPLAGDYNGDGDGYDLLNTPAFGRVLHVSRSNYQNGLFKPNDFLPTGGTPLPSPGTEGNLGRNVYNGPGYADVNIAIQRAFPLRFLGDAGRFEIRADFMNAFNRVNLQNPVGDISNPSFGQSTATQDPRQIQLVGHIRF